MSRGGSFERLDVGREFCVGWRKHHACVPSNTDLNQAVEGTHKRQPSCLGSIRVLIVVRGPAALAMHSPQEPRR